MKENKLPKPYGSTYLDRALEHLNKAKEDIFPKIVVGGGILMGTAYGTISAQQGEGFIPTILHSTLGFILGSGTSMVGSIFGLPIYSSLVETIYEKHKYKRIQKFADVINKRMNKEGIPKYAYGIGNYEIENHRPIALRSDVIIPEDKCQRIEEVYNEVVQKAISPIYDLERRILKYSFEDFEDLTKERKLKTRNNLQTFFHNEDSINHLKIHLPVKRKYHLPDGKIIIQITKFDGYYGSDERAFLKSRIHRDIAESNTMIKYPMFYDRKDVQEKLKSIDDYLYQKQK